MAEKKLRCTAARPPATDEMRIYISPVMFVMAVYFVAMGMAYEFCCSLAAVLLHECAHAKIAKRLGYGLNVIRLMPYGAALCGDADIRPKHEITIALSGPLFNLAVAVLFAALWWLLPSSYMFTRVLCDANLFIGVFNLLPVYPLDGGRVLLAALSCKIKRQKACKIMRVVSISFGLVAIALFALSAVYALNISLLSVGLFMIVSAFIPDDRARYRALFVAGTRAERLAAPLEVRRYAVSQSARLADVCTALDPDRYSEFTVLDAELSECGRLDETELINAVKLYGYDKSMGDIVKKCDASHN